MNCNVFEVSPANAFAAAEGYTIWGLIQQGARGFLGGLMGWMGVMSLIEAHPDVPYGDSNSPNILHPRILRFYTLEFFVVKEHDGIQQKAKHSWQIQM